MEPTRHLTRAQIDALQSELDQIRDDTRATLGERDARYIRSVVRVARSFAISGRAMLMFGITPISWILGALALGVAKILDNMEIGHNVLHGQYDWMNDPALDSQTFEWDNVCTSEHWRHSHNYMHHTFTNILGKDKDVGYGLLRVTDEQRWSLKHAFQPLSNAILALLFQFGVGVHDIDFKGYKAGRITGEQLRAQARPVLRKIGLPWVKDYVLFPALALWNWPRVLLGNLVANGIRNVWTNVIIFCGHFPDGTRVYTIEETANETRGDWYVRQMQGSANITGSRTFYILTGHLSHQIEHHLFPDIPAHRYPEIAPRVRALCIKYGLPYNCGSFWKQYGSVLKNNLRLTMPAREAQPVAA
jgi:linoleoyl-CoA desaturase